MGFSAMLGEIAVSGAEITGNYIFVRYLGEAGVACSAIMCFGAPYVARLFLDVSEPAYGICAKGLQLFSTGILFIILNVVLVGYLQSVERSARATVYTLLRGFILVIPCFIFLPRMIGESGMWLAIPVSELLSFTVILCTRKGHSLH